MDRMNIQVGSDNGHKRAAAEESVKDIFQGIPCEVTGNKVDQGLNAQLEGKDEIMNGALHRMAKLKEVIGETRADLLLVMQDGIYSQKIEDTEHWFNMAWIIAEDANGNRSYTSSTAIEIDADIVTEARKIDPSRNRRGFENTTIGDIIAEREGGESDSTDPQSTITNHILGRSAILKQALKAAIGQLLLKSKTLREIRSSSSLDS